MKTTVVFDVGNVLLEYDPMRYLSGKYPQEKAEDLLQWIFHSREWAELDRGTLSMEEACQALCDRHPGDEAAIRDSLMHWTESFVPIPPMMELLEDLHKNGVRLYYLSNISEPTTRFMTEAYGFWQLFQGGIFSYAELLLKPDPAIYRRLLEKFGLQAEQCVFVDDTPANVRAAQEAGMGGIVQQEAAQTRRELAELLGLAL